jgi:hypothetical protein
MIILYRVFINTMSIVFFTYLAQALYSSQRDRKGLLSFIIITALGTNILVYMDKYIGMGLRAFLALLIMVIMSYMALRLSLIQSIVTSIIYVISLAVGDISAVFIMVKIYGYTLQMIKSHILLSVTSD